MSLLPLDDTFLVADLAFTACPLAFSFSHDSYFSGQRHSRPITLWLLGPLPPFVFSPASPSFPPFLRPRKALLVSLGTDATRKIT